MSEPLRDEDELLAAELAFGLIDGEERRAAEARVDADATFAEAFQRWQDYAVAMLAGSEEPPRPSIWPAIAARLPANDAQPVLGPASAPAPAARTNLRWWQAGTAMATAAAVVLGVIATQRAPLTPAPPALAPAAPQPAPPLVAVLTGTGKYAGTVLTVSYDRASGHLTSAPIGLKMSGHAAQLWVIPAGEKPRSLGVVAARVPGWTSAPNAATPALVAGATLALSVEPIGGSPTGQPTGPVILTGTIGET